MTDIRKANIFTTRPPGESDEDSREAINAELSSADIEISELEKGSTQPDGSTIWYAYY